MLTTTGGGFAPGDTVEVDVRTEDEETAAGGDAEDYSPLVLRRVPAAAVAHATTTTTTTAAAATAAAAAAAGAPQPRQ